MSNNITPFDEDLYEAYADYIKIYEESLDEYKRDKNDYKHGELTEKPYKYNRRYYPDEEDYFSTRIAEFLKLLPDNEAFSDIIDKSANGESLTAQDKAALREYIKDMKNTQKRVYSHAAKTLNELTDWYQSGVDVDEESIAKVSSIRHSEKRLYKAARKYVNEHKADYQAHMAAVDEQNQLSLTTQTMRADLDDHTQPHSNMINPNTSNAQIIDENTTTETDKPTQVSSISITSEKVYPMYEVNSQALPTERREYIANPQYKTAEIQTVINDTNGESIQVALLDGQKHGVEMYRDKDGKVTSYKLYDHGCEITGDHSVSFKEHELPDGTKATISVLNGKPFGAAIVFSADDQIKAAFYEQSGTLINGGVNASIKHTEIHTTMSREELVQRIHTDQERQQNYLKNLENILPTGSHKQQSLQTERNLQQENVKNSRNTAIDLSQPYWKQSRGDIVR